MTTLLRALFVVGASALAVALLAAVFIGLCVVLDHFVGLGREERLDELERRRRHT